MESKGKSLSNYYRLVKNYVKLPSGANYYDKSVVELNDDGEIGVMAMTGGDEIILKNPDALLNGSAMTTVIKSCVPSIKDPMKLLTNDVDVIMIAIRLATYGAGMDVGAICPSCKHSNHYSIDLANVLNGISMLDPVNPVNLSNGLTVFVRPHTLADNMLSLKVQFEQSKIQKTLMDAYLPEERRLSLISQAFNDMAKLNIDLLVRSVINVVDEANSIDVNDKAEITGLLNNIDKNSLESIEAMSRTVNRIGAMMSMNATCTECNHEWDVNVDYNPINFSTGS